MKQTANTDFFKIALVCALVVLALSAWGRQAPAAALAPTAQEETCDTGRSVHASGAAVVYVTPDRALLSLGVQSNGLTPEGVQQENMRQIQAVIRAISALGVEEKEIATDHYLVYPVYEDYSSLVISGYRVDNTVSITLHDVGLADDVLIAALKAGANEVLDVQFYTSELRRYRDQAREVAMKAAGEKAQALAEAAGAQAGCVLSISENTWSQYSGSWRGGRQAALWAQNAVLNAGPAEGAPLLDEDSPVSLGQIVVRAEVTASYSMQ